MDYCSPFINEEDARQMKEGDQLIYSEDGQEMLCEFVEITSDTPEWFGLKLRVIETTKRNGVYEDASDGEVFTCGGHPKYPGYWGWYLKKAKS